MNVGATRVPGRSPGGTAGFTLVEIVVALLLLEVILLGAIVSMRLGAYRARRALVLEHAVWAARSLADSIEHVGVDGSASRDRAWGWLVAGGDRVEARDSTGRLLVSLEVGP